MPVTGVFFIPANPNSSTALATVVNQLRAAYDAVPTGRWALEHKLLRDTPSCLPPSAYAPLPQLQPRFMHFLSLSHFQSHGFVYISDRPSPDPWETPQPHQQPIQTAAQLTQQHHAATTNQPIKTEDSSQQPTSSSSSSPQWTMITPDPASFTSLLGITLRACEPLWCLRHTMGVTAGTVFEVGDFRVHVGDVRQTQPVQRVRGCVVEIEYRGPGQGQGIIGNESSYDDDIDWFEVLESGSTGSATAKATLQTDGDDGVGFLEFPGTVDVEEDLPTVEDWRDGETMIREFWGRFAVPGAKEAIRVPGLMTEVGRARQGGTKRVTTTDAGMFNTGIAGTDLARQYMEVLRLNR